MTDCCTAHVHIHERDIEAFCKAFNSDPQLTSNVPGGHWKKLMFESCNYGDHGALVECAAVPLRFYGYHGPGSGYPASVFASNGDGTLYLTRGIQDSAGFVEPVVTMDIPTASPSADELDDVTAVVEIYAALVEEARGGSVKLDQPAFNRFLEARLDALNNFAIVAEMGHDAAIVCQLLDYIRAHTVKYVKQAADPDIRIKNRAPEADAINLEIDGGSVISIWRDELGPTHVAVHSSDGSCTHMVLGQEGYTQRL